MKRFDPFVSYSEEHQLFEGVAYANCDLEHLLAWGKG
jgi:hypothetical protein